MKPLLALTIKQPWTYAILNLGKDIENRDWHTHFRGTIAVHASKKLDWADAESFMISMHGKIPDVQLDRVAQMWNEQKIIGGHILGTVDIVGCVKRSDSPWFQGEYGFVLENPVRLFEPVPCAGKLKFWEVPKDIERQVMEQL